LPDPVPAECYAVTGQQRLHQIILPVSTTADRIKDASRPRLGRCLFNIYRDRRARILLFVENAINAFPLLNTAGKRLGVAYRSASLLDAGTRSRGSLC